MAALEVPREGLSLLRSDGGLDAHGEATAKPTQVLRLNLAQDTIDELLQSLRRDQKARLRLGKHPALHYGSKTQPFFTSPETNRSEVYLSSPYSGTEKSLYFSGLLSHNLEVQRAKEATASTDEALANLERSLNAFERGKESKKTTMITTIHQMRALGAGDNRTATGREAASLARLPMSRIDAEKERFFKNAANRSGPVSPALLEARSPIPVSSAVVTPTSAPLPGNNTDKARLDALRVPFIHLLALRPVSLKFLSQRTRSSREDCKALAQKYAVENRLDREKYVLKDKAYKELDVWEFAYPTQEERHEAIENAISAYDRMRISRQDKLWQMLLPQPERGKGKVLSRLNLHTGAMSKNVNPPRPQAPQSDEQGKDGDGTGNESEPATGDAGRASDGPAANLKSQKAVVAQKKQIPAAKRAPTKSRAVTLTGKVTKKTDKPPDKKSSSKGEKFKSEEFVRDSDEDDTDMVDVAPSDKPAAIKSTPAASSKPTGSLSKPGISKGSGSLAKKDSEADKQRPAASSTNPSKARGSSSGTTARTHHSNSPRKPSPLGSSPPTNASGFDTTQPAAHTSQSSSSSSPLIRQLPRQKATAAITTKAVSTPNSNIAIGNKASTNPLKRKADAESVSSADKVNGSTWESRTTIPVKPRGLGITHVNGASAVEPKRRRPSSPSSCVSTSTGGGSPPLSEEILRQRLLEKSRLFKKYYAKYRALHEDMTKHPSPPVSQIEKLQRQHNRLQKMKQEIWDEDRRLRSR